MNNQRIKQFCVLMVSLVLILSGCESEKKKVIVKEMAKPDPSIFETTLSNMADIYQSGTFNVEAYGLVGGLNGTGSSECDPAVRAKLIRHIQKELDTSGTSEANTLINSMDTAVVYVRGVIPTLAMAGEAFDIQVYPLPGTQTTSLEGGRLYSIDLSQNASVNFATPIARAKGPIFVNKVSEEQSEGQDYYVLGGGQVIKDAPLALWLKEPNYYTSNAIRNRINERFGMGIARAVSPEEVSISFPEKYLDNKVKFIGMIEQLYIGTDLVLTQNRIEMLAEKLVNDTNKEAAEIALETIGKSSIKTVAPLLDSEDPDVRFYVARCLMNLGDVRGLRALEEEAHLPTSKYRMAAIEAIGSSASKDDAVKVLEPLLNDSDENVLYAAYWYLRQMGSFAITRKVIGGDFIIENVMSQGPDIIYVSRNKVPKVVIFGAPLKCNPDLFAKSDDGRVVITAEDGDDYVSLMRQNPTKSGFIGPFRSSYDISDVVRTLGEVAVPPEDSSIRPGLAVPYSEIINILKRMCDQKMVDAKFVAGPMTEVKPLTSSGAN